MLLVYFKVKVKLFINDLVSVRVKKMVDSYRRKCDVDLVSIINVLSSIPDVLDVITDRPGNFFSKRLGTRSSNILT